MNQRSRHFFLFSIFYDFKKLLLSLFILCFASACTTNSAVTSFPSVESASSSVDLNKEISNSAVLKNVESLSDVYYLGAGDILELTVFQVEELNKKSKILFERN